ncbi:aminotransferase class IV [Jiulongibacter sediminis]|jgi:4-amino-4-deoxychorismate lyase|uniref:aminotransferase class IV n=1 Tax=Jiulongibacter sediminis TaxID=1605367 RepID=UPI0026F19EDF|nr:aminotransferase class IV [Jiulongibacter sediminis]
MSLYFETIKYQRGEFFLLDYHEDRLNRTRFSQLGEKNGISLSAVLSDPPADNQLYRCRVSYGQNIIKVEYFPYSIAEHQTIGFQEVGGYTYYFKAENRDYLNESVTRSGQSDVIYLKEGQLTDASYSNLVFFNGTSWFTPETYLLNGVKRQFLMHQKLIKEAKIRLDNIHDFSKIALINAMRDFELVYDFELRNGLIHLTLAQ